MKVICVPWSQLSSKRFQLTICTSFGKASNHQGIRFSFCRYGCGSNPKVTFLEKYRPTTVFSTDFLVVHPMKGVDHKRSFSQRPGQKDMKLKVKSLMKEEKHCAMCSSCWYILYIPLSFLFERKKQYIAI